MPLAHSQPPDNQLNTDLTSEEIDERGDEIAENANNISSKDQNMQNTNMPKK